jgi:hypothetical protein
MNPAESKLSETDGGEITKLLEQYLLLCRTDCENDDGKKKKCKDATFPNLAGFCRFIGISTSELEAYGEKFSTEYERILTVLEDEALNSGLSPALVSSYLKKRLGYDGTNQAPKSPQLEIKFEHDIFEDGE